MKKSYLSLLVIALICLTIPIVSAFEKQEPEALLIGKTLIVGEHGSDNKLTTTLLTDNDRSTYINLPRATDNSGVNDIVWLNFGKEYILTGYKLTATSGAIINLSLGNKNGFSKITMNNVTGEFVPIDHPEVVNRFSIYLSGYSNNSNLTSVDIYDIELYGYEVSVPTAPLNLDAISGDSNVILTWDRVDTAITYNISRSETPSGPYTSIATNIEAITFTDTSVINGTTYYYVVTAINPNGESNLSNEALATPQGSVIPPVDPPDSGNRAILIITLDTGLEKEYDLSMTEVSNFISWYESKSAGTGTASYAINKGNNNKGPFTNREEYIIFNKILTFEVNEYEVE